MLYGFKFDDDVQVSGYPDAVVGAKEIYEVQRARAIGQVRAFWDDSTITVNFPVVGNVRVHYMYLKEAEPLQPANICFTAFKPDIENPVHIEGSYIKVGDTFFRVRKAGFDGRIWTIKYGEAGKHISLDRSVIWLYRVI